MVGGSLVQELLEMTTRLRQFCRRGTSMSSRDCQSRQTDSVARRETAEEMRGEEASGQPRI